MSSRSIGDVNKTNGQSSLEDAISPLVPHADVRPSGAPADKNQLNGLGQTIFLDRYAMKDMRKRTLAVGDLVIVCVDPTTGQREIGIVSSMDKNAGTGGGRVVVELQEGARIECLSE